MNFCEFENEFNKYSKKLDFEVSTKQKKELYDFMEMLVEKNIRFFK